MTTTQDEPVAELSTEECWELLEREQFGRLAYRLVDEVHLVPINYAADAGALLFRTASGNKLLAAALHSDVAFEIDWHDEVAAWSVVVRGGLHRLGEDEAERVEELLPQSWVPTQKYDVIELQPDVVTGRRFLLQRPEPGHQEPATGLRKRRSAMWDMEPPKVLVAVDSSFSDAALRYAVADARRRGCGIHVVHVDRLTIWSHVVDEVSLVEGELRHPGASVLAAAAVKVEKMIDQQAPDDGRLSVSTELTHGSVVAALQSLSKHASVLVLEHHGMGDAGRRRPCR